MYDLIVISVIAIGMVSGMRTLHTNKDYFQEFQTRDFWNGRVDSWLYLCNVISTSTCIIDLFLRLQWYTTGGCPYCDPKWLGFWLSFHLLIALNAILIHVTTNNLLRRTDFCNLCKREYVERRSE